MEPKAVLVLYEPGLRLKNNKYLLSIGVNIVGNDPKCQVYIANSKSYFSQDYVASFYITDDFMYIEALCDNMVQFKSNMQIQSSGRKKDIYRYIDKNCRYILPMEEIFYIGPYKAIVQVQAEHELRQIKNILNLENFQTPKGDDAQYVEDQNQGEEKVERKDLLNLNKMEVQIDERMDAKSDNTEKIDSQSNYAFQPTLVIDDDDPYVYEPTLLIQDDYPLISKKISSQSKNFSVRHQNEPKSQSRSPMRSPARSPQGELPSQDTDRTKTLNKRPKPISQQFSDVSLFSRQKEKRGQGFSQQILYETIKKEEINLAKLKSNQQSPQQDEISMPDTIKDNQSQKKQAEQELDQIDMPPTIQDNLVDEQMPPTIQQDEMPPTIQEDEIPPIIKQNDNSPEKKPKISKTMHEKKPTKSTELSKTNLYKSEKISKANNEDEIEDQFWGLFGRSNIKKIDSNELEIPEEKKEIKKKSLLNSELLNFKNERVLPHVNVEEFGSSNNIMMKSNGSSINFEKQEKQKLVKQKQATSKKSTSPISPDTFVSNFAKKKNPNEKPKMIALTGYKPTAEDRLTIKQRGYQIVPNGTDETYELLIIGNNIEPTERLLMSILLDKQIVTEDWLKDKEWEMKMGKRLEGLIQGISWEVIDEQRGKKEIFAQCGSFYFTETIKQLARVFELGGGTLITQSLKLFNKRKKLNIIVNCASVEDKQIYKQYGKYKSWKFYSHKLIGESVLTGVISLKKYEVDEDSF